MLLFHPEFNDPVPKSSELFYHCFNVTTQNASVHVRVVPNDGRQYLVLGRRDDFPRLKGKPLGWDFMGLAPRNMSSECAAQRKAALNCSDICLLFALMVKANTSRHAKI